MKSFTQSVEDFLTAADYLTAEDAPMIVALQQTAKQLDLKYSPAALAQFGLTFRYLAKRQPQESPSVDPLEALLTRES